MKKKFIYISFFIFLALGAGLFIHLDNRGGMNGSVVPFGLKPDAVRMIHVKGNKEEFRLERGEEHWAVVERKSEETRVVANEEKVYFLLATLSNLIPIDTVVSYSHRSPNDVGFEHIDVHVTVTPQGKSGESAKSVEVVLGRRPGSNHSWVWLSSAPEKLYRVSKNALNTAEKSAVYYYDKRVLPFDASKAVKLQLAQKYAGGWTVARTDDGFKFELPAYLEGKDAANAEVKLYLLMLAALRADAFLPSDVTAGNDPEAFINVWLDGKAGQALRLDLYRDPSPGAGYLATSTYQEGVFRFDVESVRQLFKTPFELQGRRVVELDIGKVASIRVMSGNQVFLANKKSGGWFVGDTEKQLAGIDMSLWRFNELKFEALPLKTLPESASWTMSCDFTDSEGGKVASLTFFSDPALPEGQSWLKNGGELYYPVSNQLMKDLQGLFPTSRVQ